MEASTRAGINRLSENGRAIIKQSKTFGTLTKNSYRSDIASINNHGR